MTYGDTAYRGRFRHSRGPDRIAACDARAASASPPADGAEAAPLRPVRTACEGGGRGDALRAPFRRRGLGSGLSAPGACHRSGRRRGADIDERLAVEHRPPGSAPHGAPHHHAVPGRSVAVGRLAARRVETDREAGITLHRRGGPPADAPVARAALATPETDVGGAREPPAERREPVARLRLQPPRRLERSSARRKTARTLRPQGTPPRPRSASPNCLRTSARHRYRARSSPLVPMAGHRPARERRAAAPPGMLPAVFPVLSFVDANADSTGRGLTAIPAPVSSRTCMSAARG